MMSIIFRDGKPVICVKDNHIYAHDPIFKPFYESIPERRWEIVYEQMQETFWIEVNDIAQSYGYGNVYSEGRSNGWLAVENPPDVAKFGLDPSVTRAGKRWIRFTQDVEDLMDSLRSRMAEELREIVENPPSLTEFEAKLVNAMLVHASTSAELHEMVENAVEWIEAHPSADHYTEEVAR